ncbi:MAG: twin-arginine translocation signal domain-containing protein, partial [Chloroflexi bacterium]|nr:twin-arginine translocation signal domain-containing protein [Chloroflexota bacterium]
MTSETHHRRAFLKLLALAGMLALLLLLLGQP